MYQSLLHERGVDVSYEYCRCGGIDLGLTFASIFEEAQGRGRDDTTYLEAMKIVRSLA